MILSNRIMFLPKVTLMVEKWVYVLVYWLGACLAVPITLFVTALVCEIVTRRRPPVDDGN